MQYFTLLTKLGARMLANAQATATEIKLTHMAIGDGNGEEITPTVDMTSLVNQRYKAEINQLYQDENNQEQLIAEFILPEDVGDFWLREVGLFTEDGTLFAVGNLPPSYKPILASGSSRTQTIRMVLVISSDAQVTLKVDPSIVLATQDYVNNEVAIIQNAYQQADSDLKAYSDSEDAKLQSQINVVETKVKQATETKEGIQRNATTEEAIAGVADNLTITPKSLQEVLFSKKNKKYRNVLSQRKSGITYTNTTDDFLFVAVSLRDPYSNNAIEAYVDVDNQRILSNVYSSAAPPRVSVFFIVPPFSTYKVKIGDTTADVFETWREL